MDFCFSYTSRRRDLDQGPKGEAESVNPVFDGKLRRYLGRARARPLPALDSLLRSIGASFQAPDICRPLPAAEAEEAASSTSAELAEFTSKIGRRQVSTPVTWSSRTPASACKTKK